MKAARHYSIILIFACCVSACSPPQNADSSELFSVGVYQYTGYDKSGGKVVEGQLSITSVLPKRTQSAETVEITGNWQLNKVGNQEHIGEQVGSGKLIGSITKGEIILNLNPNISDSNVYLKGVSAGKRFHGTWSFSGYAGAINQGTFEAIRK